jgi:hypothetical protein
MLQQHFTTDYSGDIAAALKTPGGHLSLGRGGFILHYGDGAMLSGYDCDAIKTQSIAAGLPVIDSRCVAFDVVVQLTLGGPLVAVGRAPEPAPWHGLSYAPLHAVAIRYAAAGAEIWNIPEVETLPAPAERRTGP